MSLIATEPPAVNASPLIFLARSDLVHLLQLAGSTIIVPKPVADEILRRGPGDPTVKALAATKWLKTVEPTSIPDVIQGWDLGPGESSVLAWGLAQPGTECIIDDLAARRCAQTLGIPVRGTLGLVIEGKKKGKFPAARPVLEHMRRNGMFLSDRVLNRALAMIDE